MHRAVCRNEDKLDCLMHLLIEPDASAKIPYRVSQFISIQEISVRSTSTVDNLALMLVD